MNATELRIGNWSIWDGHEKQVEADQLSTMFYGQHESDGIILNISWLKKFGFKKSTEEYVDDWCGYTVFSNVIDIGNKEGRYFLVEFGANYIEEKQVYSHYPNEIIYVHQLQNLYFALTSQELEIK